MQLSNAYLRPGKVREVIDSYGNVKCSVVGIFKEDEDLEKLPPIAPSPFMKASPNSFVQPQVGDDVWVMLFYDNPQLLFYSFRAEAKVTNSGDLDNNYKNVEMISKRGEGVFMYDDEDGYTLKNEGKFINVGKDVNIANGDRSITITDNGIRINNGGENQPMVLGNNLKECLQDMVSLFESIKTSAMSNPNTMQIGVAMNAGLIKIKSKLKTILSKDNFVS